MGSLDGRCVTIVWVRRWGGSLWWISVCGGFLVDPDGGSEPCDEVCDCAGEG